MKRKYHVVVINERTGAKTYMTGTPVTQDEGCTILSKLTKYPWRREQLEETIEVRCTATMPDGREKTVTECAGSDIGKVLETLQSKRAKWCPFVGCEVIVGHEAYVLEDAWGVFSLVK